MAEKYEGFPREEIPWYPKIDQGVCTGCGACAEFCHKGVYAKGDKVEVKNPFSCVVGCTGCLKQCPAEAISFPSLRDLVLVLKELEKKYGKRGKGT
jgi:NAD-dependent dihydropyrimidine dehydrogenase PreA subunit